MYLLENITYLFICVYRLEKSPGVQSQARVRRHCLPQHERGRLTDVVLSDNVVWTQPQSSSLYSPTVGRKRKICKQ